MRCRSGLCFHGLRWCDSASAGEARLPNLSAAARVLGVTRGNIIQSVATSPVLHAAIAEGDEYLADDAHDGLVQLIHERAPITKRGVAKYKRDRKDASPARAIRLPKSRARCRISSWAKLKGGCGRIPSIVSDTPTTSFVQSSEHTDRSSGNGAPLDRHRLSKGWRLALRPDCEQNEKHGSVR